MVKNVIFDQGDVLIRLDYKNWHNTIKQYRPDVDEAGFDEFHERLHMAFSEGLLEEATFERELANYLGNPALTRQELKEIHTSIFINGPTRATTLIERLAQKYKLFIFSNTDPWHVEYLSGVIPGFKTCFADRIYSFDAHALKPDRKIYDYLLSRTGIMPEESVYFDDVAENVAQGNAMGFVSVQVTDENLLYDYISKNLLDA